MSKYYITCGNMQYIISSQTADEAIRKFVKEMHGRGILLSPIIYVDEKGFNKTNKYNTDAYLKEEQ